MQEGVGFVPEIWTACLNEIVSSVASKERKTRTETRT